MRLLFLTVVLLVLGCQPEANPPEPTWSLPTSVGQWGGVDIAPEELGIVADPRVRIESKRFTVESYEMWASLGTGQATKVLLSYNLSTRHTPIYYDGISDGPTTEVLTGRAGEKIELTRLVCERWSHGQRSKVVLYWSFWDGVRWASPTNGDQFETFSDHASPISKLYVIAPIKVESGLVHEFMIELCDLQLRRIGNR